MRAFISHFLIVDLMRRMHVLQPLGVPKAVSGLAKSKPFRPTFVAAPLLER
jgi:hypothetical protein